MIKAVFFDWFNTLARYEPPREELHRRALQELGIRISPDKIKLGLLVADRDFFAQNAVLPVRKRSPEEQTEFFTRYQTTILTEAGVDVAGEAGLALKVMKKVRELSAGLRFVLFDDVLATLKVLKEKSLILGLLTNLDKDMASLCRELGLESYINFSVTSGEVGADKPEPPIFRAALQRAGVKAAEAVHVGDQYKIDITGARGVGISPILLDRYDQYSDVKDCPRIKTLPEVVQYLN